MLCCGIQRALAFHRFGNRAHGSDTLIPKSKSRSGGACLEHRGHRVRREKPHAEGGAVAEEEVREGLFADVDG
jgi:hypothetical protein